MPFDAAPYYDDLSDIDKTKPLSLVDTKRILRAARRCGDLAVDGIWRFRTPHAVVDAFLGHARANSCPCNTTDGEARAFLQRVDSVHFDISCYGRCERIPLLDALLGLRSLPVPAAALRETVDEVKVVIRAARSLGIMACDHARELDRSPFTSVDVDGFEVVSPRGAVAVIYWQGQHRDHSPAVNVFFGELEPVHEMIFFYRKYGDPQGRLARFEAQWKTLLAG
jgi:hypothetical protein